MPTLNYASLWLKSFGKFCLVAFKSRLSVVVSWSFCGNQVLGTSKCHLYLELIFVVVCLYLHSVDRHDLFMLSYLLYIFFVHISTILLLFSVSAVIK